MNRREAMFTLGTAGALAASRASAVEPAAAPKPERPLLAMIAYPGMFPVDLIGPEAVFSPMGTHRVALVWKTLDPVRSASGVGIVPNLTFAQADAAGPVDILFVPGGSLGTLACMEDPEVLGFLARHAPTARHVTSVCTGSLVLGAAGLLKGYRATSHWIVRDRLADFGATPVEARVVEDRNRITGAGVTAGIDMALTLAGRLVGADMAKAIQLNIEYDPHPPFDAGTPRRAGGAITDRVTRAYAPFLARVGEVAARAAAHVRGA